MLITESHNCLIKNFILMFQYCYYFLVIFFHVGITYIFANRPHSGEIRNIDIEKSAEPLGIQIRCLENGGVFVSAVTLNSLASQVWLIHILNCHCYIFYTVRSCDHILKIFTYIVIYVLSLIVE